jgi:hypothetical protein
MRINFCKGEFIPMNIEGKRIHEIAHILKCPIGKYLGVLLHFDKLRREGL